MFPPTASNRPRDVKSDEPPGCLLTSQQHTDAHQCIFSNVHNGQGIVKCQVGYDDARSLSSPSWQIVSAIEQVSCGGWCCDSEHGWSCPRPGGVICGEWSTVASGCRPWLLCFSGTGSEALVSRLSDNSLAPPELSPASFLRLSLFLLSLHL